MTYERQQEMVRALVEFGNLLLSTDFPGELQWRPTFAIAVDTTEELVTAAKVLGDCQKSSHAGHLSFEKTFGQSFRVKVACYKETQCKVKSRQQVWVPERPATEGFYREDTEWECPESLLASTPKPEEDNG